jgi:starch-binding outer membrane protein, SusD/RagB family
MKKNSNLITATLAIMVLFNACRKDMTEINATNPNQFSGSEGRLMITGAELANVLVNGGEAARMAGIFSGYFTGADRQYLALHQYSYTAGDFDNIWGTLYAEGVAQCRLIKDQAKASNDMVLHSVAAITEANLLLTASGLWGDIPQSEACNNNFAEPKYDNMDDVHTYCIGLLDNAATIVAGSSAHSGAYEGGHDWGQVANTLKARALLRKGDYSGAAAAAANGVEAGKDLISNHSADVPGAWNLFFDFCYWNRGGYMTCENSFLSTLLDSASSAKRHNAKTNEDARFAYYYSSGTADNYSSRDPNYLDGIFASSNGFTLVGYAENQLILAECASRLGDNDKALEHLNNVRSSNAGMFADGLYDAYDLSDFGPGKMVEGTSATDALRMEILVEKYASLYGQLETYSDLRRTKNAIGVPLNKGTQMPQRFLFPQSEINSNGNVPKDQLDKFLPLSYFQ